MGFSARQIADWVGGRIANADALGPLLEAIRVEATAGLAGAQPRHCAYFFNKAYQGELLSAQPGVLITGEPFVLPLQQSGLPLWKKSAVIACRDPYLALAQLSGKFAEAISTVVHPPGRERPSQIHPTAVIDPSAQLGAGVCAMAHVVVEAGAQIGARSTLYPGTYVGPGAKIGADTVLFANVSVYERVRIGDRCRIHSGTVLGSDGFGYAPRVVEGLVVEHEKIHHTGSVVIGDDVEIKLKGRAGIREAMVIGDGRPHCVALVSMDLAIMNEADLLRWVDEINKSLPPHEQVRTVGYVTESWTVDSGEMTPSLKLKRRIILDRYEKQIEELFENRSRVRFVGSTSLKTENELSAHLSV
jgi:UDP-3-O-[3-hydroxymyristoyl] glucosamine N-acyltransferase LpxD